MYCYKYSIKSKTYHRVIYNSVIWYYHCSITRFYVTKLFVSFSLVSLYANVRKTYHRQNIETWSFCTALVLHVLRQSANACSEYIDYAATNVRGKY